MIEPFFRNLSFDEELWLVNLSSIINLENRMYPLIKFSKILVDRTLASLFFLGCLAELHSCIKIVYLHKYNHFIIEISHRCHPQYIRRSVIVISKKNIAKTNKRMSPPIVQNSLAKHLAGSASYILHPNVSFIKGYVHF